jgi:hypothetical protein
LFYTMWQKLTRIFFMCYCLQGPCLQP